jgi:hypothetical protein
MSPGNISQRAGLFPEHSKCVKHCLNSSIPLLSRDTDPDTSWSHNHGNNYNSSASGRNANYLFSYLCDPSDACYTDSSTMQVSTITQSKQGIDLTTQ